MLDHTTVLLDPIFKQDLQVATANSLFAEPGRVEYEKKKWLDAYNNGKGEGIGEMTKFGGSAAVAFIKFPEEERNQWPEWKALSDEDRKRFLDKTRPDTEIFYLVRSTPSHFHLDIRISLTYIVLSSLVTFHLEGLYLLVPTPTHMPVFS